MWRTVQFLGLAFLVSGCLDQMPNDIFKRPVLQNAQVIAGGQVVTGAQVVTGGQVGTGGAEPRRIYVRRVRPDESVVPIEEVPQQTTTQVEPIRVVPTTAQQGISNTGNRTGTTNNQNTGGIIHASPNNQQPNLVRTPSSTGISDEQDFDAVSSRQTIESDASRLEANRQLYKVIAPTALPTRSGSVPNVVAYALQTNNPVGVQLYRRLGLISE